MKTLFLTFILFSASFTQAQNLQGWEHLASRLDNAIDDSDRIKQIYSDKRLGEFTELSFALKPKERKSIYQGFLSSKKVSQAKQCLDKHSAAFHEAEARFGVPATVLAALIFVETWCGKNTGNYLVVWGLSRLAAAATPWNIQKNYKRLKASDSSVSFEKVRDRALYLEERFLPEIVALFDLVKELGLDLFELKGSRAGALGMAQFLPSTYINYKFDGDRDGAISPYSPFDAIHSAANYLAVGETPWNPNKPALGNKPSLLMYNNSDPYADTILSLASKLAQKYP